MDGNESTEKNPEFTIICRCEKKEFDRLLPAIRKENEVLLKLFSLIAAPMFFVLAIVSMVSHGFATVNSPTYLICGMIMMLIYLCVKFIVPKHPRLIMLLVYTFEIELYVFGVYISMLHAERPAVSAVAFLLVAFFVFLFSSFRNEPSLVLLADK